jgi:ferric-dicitrate binding protein FerR (iron transport regulator)
MENESSVPPENRGPEELIVRVLQGLASPEERSRLRAWRKAATENELMLWSVARLWEESASLDPSPRDPQIAPPAAAELLRDHEASAGSPESAKGESRPLDSTGGGGDSGLWRVLGWSALATAAAVALIGMGFLLGDQLGSSSPTPEGLEAAELRTGPNELASVRLSDGTVVRLAPESRLRVGGVDGSREVWLEGRAFFAVPPSVDGRFLVRTPVGEAVALGTRFDVWTEDRAMQLIVVEGEVALSDGVSEVELGAHQMSRIENASHIPVVDLADVYGSLTWMGSTLAFQSTPLGEVAAELERRFAVQMEVDAGLAEDRSVTAWFTEESFEDVMSVICRALDVTCDVDAGGARVMAGT